MRWQGWGWVLGMAAANLAAAPSGSEIVVTATREWTDAARTPGSLSVITREEMARTGARNLAEALDDVPGVLVRRLSGPVAELSMRGGGENSQGRVLVLLDGRRLNNPDMASMNWLQIPLNLIERVEVLRGGQTALYGDFASQGVVHIITRKGSAQPSAELSVQTGSDDTALLRAGVSGSAGRQAPISYAANAEWQRSNGDRDRSGYEGVGAGGRIGADLPGGIGLSAAGSWYRSDYELPGDLTRAEMRNDPEQSGNPNDATDNRYGNAGLDLTVEAGAGVRFDLGLGWSAKRTESDVESWFLFSDTDLDSYTVQPRVTVEGDWGGMAHRAMAGLDVALDRMDVDRYEDAARTDRAIAAELRKRTTGGYLRHQVEAVPGWVVNAGYRVEAVQVKGHAHSRGASVLDDAKTQRAQAWETGLTYAFAPGSKLFGRVGRVYRYPFLDELVSYYGYGSDTLYRDLDAEKGVTAEAGVELGDHPVWRAGATLFRLDMEDEVAWDPVAYRNANLDRTRRQGVEVWGRWRPAAGRIEVELSYTFTDARFRAGPADGCDVPLVPRHQALGVVRAALPRDFWADATVRYQGSAPLGGDVLNAGDELDAFTTGDLAVRYKPEGKRFSLFLGVENVTDEVYATVAYHGAFEDGYYPAPGRCWRAGMNWTF